MDEFNGQPKVYLIKKFAYSEIGPGVSYEVSLENELFNPTNIQSDNELETCFCDTFAEEIVLQGNADALQDQ